MNPTPSWRRADLVPLEQRVRFLQVVRVASVLFALALPVLVALPGGRRVDTALFAVGGGGLLVGMLLGVAVRRARTCGRWLFGLMLLVDGLLLAALVHGTGRA